MKNYKAKIDLVGLSKEEVDKVRDLVFSQFNKNFESISVSQQLSPNVHIFENPPFPTSFKKDPVRDDYRYAHFHLGSPGSDDIAGRVTLAMESEGDIVHVGLAFCSNKDQYVRAKGRKLAADRCKSQMTPYFYFERDEAYGTITEQAACELIEFLGNGADNNDPDVPHWVKKKSAFMVYFPSEVENGQVK